jgi:Fe-S cluster assembly protein SufB
VSTDTTPEVVPNAIEALNPELVGLGRYEYGWADSDVAGSVAQRGLSEAVVRDISATKSEPQWMLDLRLKGLKLFGRKPMPSWGAELETIDFDNIKYFVRSTEKQATSWDELPADIKNTYDKLGIPEAEKQRLISGVAAQYESEVVYHKIREDLEEQGVLFLDTDTALREQPELFREYFGTVIPVGDNKRAAATRRSRTGRTTSTTSSRSGRSARPARRWSGSTATSAPRSR